MAQNPVTAYSLPLRDRPSRLLNNGRLARVFALAAVGMLAAGVARSETVQIDFPPGWTVTELVAPSVDGQPVPGGRRRAMLLGADGKPQAAIELTTMPQKADTAPVLATAMHIATSTASKLSQDAGLNDVCEEPKSLQVSGKAGLRTECTISRADKVILRQTLVLSITGDNTLSLSYSAPAGLFEADAALFEHALASLRIN